MKSMPSADPRYLVAFQVDAGVRFSESAAGPSAAWQLRVQTPDGAIAVTVFDLFVDGDLGPVHKGLGLEIEVDAANLDEAVEAAGSYAVMASSLLAASARAHVGRPLPVIAFELASGIAKRDMRRWFRELPVLKPKRKADQAAFAAIAEKSLAAPDPLAFRLRMSLVLHREAMNEISDVWRFVALWMSAEAIDASLKQHFRAAKIALVSGGQHPGLETLAREIGAAAFIRDASDARNDLLHTNEGDSADVLARAAALIPQLEALIPAAWELLLGLEGWADRLPSEATTSHDSELIVTIRFVPTVGMTFGPLIHPQLSLKAEFGPLESNPDGSVASPMTLHLTKFTGIEKFDLVSTEFRGPSGPVELTSQGFQITKAEDDA